MLKSIKEFVFEWFVEVALFLDILMGLVASAII